MRAATTIAGVLLACGAAPPQPSASGEKAEPAKAEPAKAAPAKAEPTKAEPERPKRPRTGALADPIHRSKGPIRGSFVLHEQRFVVGAPIFVRFHVEAVVEPLRFTVGGDGYAQGHLRFAWVVRDAMDEVVCDLRAKPEPMAGGGGQALRELADGETYDHWLAPQTGCDALATPGRYRMRVVRVLTDDRERPPECVAILPPDTTVKPMDDRGVPVPPACARWLAAAPAVATDFEIEVLPYDAETVKAAVLRELSIGGEGRMGLLSSWGAWLCGHLGCTPGYGDAVERWLGDAVRQLPATWPAR